MDDIIQHLKNILNIGVLNVNSKQLFQIALQIEKPWFIEKIEFDESKTLHIYMKYERLSKFPCPVCGTPSPVYDSTERTWRHLNFFQYETYIHAPIPRGKCPKDGIKRIEVPWARKETGFTLLFEALVLEMVKYMAVSQVAKLFGMAQNSVWKIVRYYSNDAMDKIDMFNVKSIGIDEISAKKGHKYVTIFADASNSNVLYVTEGKDSSTVERFADVLTKHGGNAKEVKEVSMDMSKSFQKGAKGRFEKAKIMFDHFHVTKILKKALDDTRKSEMAEYGQLPKKSKYVILKRPENLRESEKEKLNMILSSESKTAQVYKLIALFENIWKYSRKAWAGLYFSRWYELVQESGIEQLKKAADSIKRHIHGILDAIVSNRNNAFLEGLNNKIRTAMRRAFGFKKLENLMAIIYLIANDQISEFLPTLS